MKRIFIFILFLIILNVTGCTSTKNYRYIDATVDADGNIVINEDDIDDKVTFINYEIDGIIVQIIAVKASDGTIRLAFNTCQSCNPSPNAYFVYDGNYLECQNCGTKFSIDELGETRGGCNPYPIDDVKNVDGKITIYKDTVDSMKEKFENWQGPTS